MLLPEQIISSLEEDIQKYFKQEKSVTSYSSDKISLKYDLKEKTRLILWSIYKNEGFQVFMDTVNCMRKFEGRKLDDVMQVKGEVAEVVLEILIKRFIAERKIHNWYVHKGVILGNKKNKKFSTEIDFILITPQVVSVIEVKSLNGDKIITDDCTVIVRKGKDELCKNIFAQNKIHIQTFWDNFKCVAKGKSGIIKSVLFSFSLGNITDNRSASKINLMPVYTEDTIASYLEAIFYLNREPVWEVAELERLISNSQTNYKALYDKHIRYINSIHPSTF
jgi:Holliday junction resolvase-like predicted endonuclease